MTTDITVLKSLTAVRLDVNIWSARKKLTPADFGTQDLPPEKLASLGSKKVCNPEDLRVFATLKARASAVLDRHGIRFLGGWAIPETSIKDIIPALQDIAHDFETAKAAFLARYDESIRQWLVANPGWEALIAGSLVGVETVRDRLGFAWAMYKVVPPKAGKGEAGSPLESEVSRLGSTLLDEVAKVANEAWHKTFAGRMEVSARALSPLRGMRTKLAGLSFVSPTALPMVDLMDAALNQIPEKGAITGPDLVMLQGLVCLLKDPQAMVDHAQRILTGQNPHDTLQDLGQLPGAAPAISATESDDAPFSEAEPHEDAPFLDSFGLW